MSKRHFDPGSNSEWMTPVKYVDAAREAMGGIDLDPASTGVANLRVRAKTYYTRQDDGLSQRWIGRVWMNPPYSDHRGQAADWISHLHYHWRFGGVDQAVALIYLVTLFQEPMQRVLRNSLLCILDHRIKFELADQAAKQPHDPTQPNAFLYLGARQEQFRWHFLEFGVVLRAYDL